MLRKVHRVIGVTPCRELITIVLERWRPEMSTFHLACGKETITLEDDRVLTGLPTRGIFVTKRTVRDDAANLCERWLGIFPPDCMVKGMLVKITWIRALFKRLYEGSDSDMVTVHTQPYVWLLMGTVLLLDQSRDYLHAYLLDLMGETDIATM
ncbi:Serine/threonine-protein phosphatase 7 long form homolog [Linum perenne]